MWEIPSMEPDEKGQVILGLALVGALLTHLEQERLAELAGDLFVIELRGLQARLEEWLDSDRNLTTPRLRLSQPGDV